MGCDHAWLSVSVPSQGGCYTSLTFWFQSSVTHLADVFPRADWLAVCQVVTRVNVLWQPAMEIVENLLEGHGWRADSMQHSTETLK